MRIIVDAMGAITRRIGWGGALAARMATGIRRQAGGEHVLKEKGFPGQHYHHACLDLVDMHDDPQRYSAASRIVHGGSV
ncbi:MAG: hypothetical protein ACLS69_03010 [Butyricicoccus sp.]